MFKTDKLYIFPCDGIAGQETELRDIPLTGFFAVKFGKNHLDRALCVAFLKSIWEVKLDGTLIARPSESWKMAFGSIYDRAMKSGGIFLGRRLFIPEYVRMVKARAADKENGVDLSDSVDLNHVSPPTFRS